MLSLIWDPAGYRQAGLQQDARVAYASHKYPWLVAVHRYPHLYTRPGDWDAVRVEVPLWVGKNTALIH